MPATVSRATIFALFIVISSLVASAQASPRPQQSECKQLDHEPPKEQQVIKFEGGRLAINASLAFRDRYQRWEKFVALKVAGEASFESPSKDWWFIYLDFDCAKIVMKIYRQQVLHFLIDYSLTGIQGNPCETTDIELTNSEAHNKVPTAYLASYCSLTAADYRPLLAVQDIKIEIEQQNN